MKIIYFSKHTAAYNLKVGGCVKVNDLIKLPEFQSSRSLFDLCQRSMFKRQSCFFSQNLLGYLKPNII